MRALLIRSPWIDMILDGKKTWELRGSRTNVRGLIALVQAGSKQVVGIATLADVVGPLSDATLRKTRHLHGVPPAVLFGARRYARTYAWVFDKPRRLSRPIPYAHPSGAVIWVNLSPHVARRVAAAARLGHPRRERRSRPARRRAG